LREESGKQREKDSHDVRHSDSSDEFRAGCPSEECGRELFEAGCQLDLEGIVATEG
jgi:hypothetical protein